MNFKKIGLYLIALLLYSFGVAGIVFSGLGASPIDAATYYSNELISIFDNLIPGFTGQGIWLINFNIIMAFIILMLTKKTKIFINLLISIAVGIIFSLAFLVYGALLPFTPEIINNNYLIVRILLALVTINFMALSIAVLANYKLMATPFDELALYVESKVGKYFISKIILDGSFLLIAILLGFIYGKPFEQINVFTIVVLVGLGPLINLYIYLLKNNKNKEDLLHETQ